MAEASPTTLCGSLSRHPVSLGALMHRAGYAALGLDYAYVPFAVENLPAAIDAMRALSIRGLGVSMPFKLDVIPLLDRLDPLAQRIGAVNTIVNDAGVLSGYNTDAWGARIAFEEQRPIAGTRVLLIGAGGAARAVAHAFAGAGAVLTIANRSVDRAERLAGAVGAQAGGLELLADLAGFDAVVNASSAGMAEYGAESPVSEAALRPGLLVMDIVYKPVRTALLLAAERRGARTVHGARMLLHQACGQFELYTGRPAPTAAMEVALSCALETA
jgi:shikimate dehydrogenase